MIQITRVTDALPVLTFDFSLSSSSQSVTLDARSQEWVHDLTLKATKRQYVQHPDFLLGYHYGDESFQEYVEEVGDALSLEAVIHEIEYALSRKYYNLNADRAAARGDSYPSYYWQVGSIFGFLAAFLQTSDAATKFPFLLAPVASVHALLASSLPPDSFSIQPRMCGSDGWPLDM